MTELRAMRGPGGAFLLALAALVVWSVGPAAGDQRAAPVRNFAGPRIGRGRTGEIR